VALSKEPLPWLSFASKHYQIHKDFEAAVENGEDPGRADDPAQRSSGPTPNGREAQKKYRFGETPPQDNRSKGDGGFRARMMAALEERERREEEREREAGG
jgi:hypothetical protein